MSASPRRILFFALCLAMLSPWASPVLALGIGLAFGLTLGNPWPLGLSHVSGLLLKISVVGLGFGMSLRAVLSAGAEGLWVTAGGILIALSLGLLIAHLLRVDRVIGQLISVGTAVCGGSAIAAVGPILGASSQAMAVSLATVFVLNGVALYLFPVIGQALDLTQHQFALWSAIAIHDTSSVVGAAASYGEEALATATVFKLVRALWIIPLSLAALWLGGRRSEGVRGRLRLPWFIGFFLLAASLRALLPFPAALWDGLAFLARRFLVLTLFLIGAGLTRATLGKLGLRPLLLGVLLWALVGSGALWAVWSWA